MLQQNIVTPSTSASVHERLEEVRGAFEAPAPVAKWLRKERELSFYGDTDFIPTEEYTKEDALREMEGAKKWIESAERVVRPRTPGGAIQSCGSIASAWLASRTGDSLSVEG